MMALFASCGPLKRSRNSLSDNSFSIVSSCWIISCDADLSVSETSSSNSFESESCFLRLDIKSISF